MTKIVINRCFGGFGLSKEAIEKYAKLKRLSFAVEYSKGNAFLPLYRLEGKAFFPQDISRNDEDLVKVVEELGKNANGAYADLKIVEIPDSVEWKIEEYDGIEHVAEVHRTWE